MFGGFGGGAAQDSRVLTTSGRWLATVIAGFAAILLTLDLWSWVEDAAASAVSRRYSGAWADVMFWALKLGVYPLVYFSTRMGIGLVFMGTALGAALKLAGRGRP